MKPVVLRDPDRGGVEEGPIGTVEALADGTSVVVTVVLDGLAVGLDCDKVAIDDPNGERSSSVALRGQQRPHRRRAASGLSLS